MYQRIALGLAVASLTVSCGDGLKRSSSNDISLDRDEVTLTRPMPGRDDGAPELIQIRSAGAAPLTITRAYLKGELEPCDLVTLGKGVNDDLGELDEVCSFLIVARDVFPKTMENGEFAQVEVIFHRNPELGPLMGEPPTGTLVIESDASTPGDEVKEVALSVIGETPKIQASPTVLAFPPDAPAGVALEESVLIRNGGTGTLLVSDIQLSLSTEPARDEAGMVVDEFELEVAPELPWVAEESDAYTLVLKYTPYDTSSDSAVITIKSNDAEHPEITLTATSEPLEGLLLVDPIVASFELSPGEFEVFVDFRFQNNGLKPVDVYDMLIQQPASDYTIDTSGGGNTSFQLAAGAVAEGLSIRYHPAGMPTDGALFVSTNADNAVAKPADLTDLLGDKVLRIPLVHDINSVPGSLALDPLSLDLSQTPAGESLEATLTLSNVGGAPLHITRIGLSTEADEAAGMATDPEFKLTEGAEAVVLAPGDTHEVVVELTRSPMDMAQHYGAIIVESDSEGSPHIVTLFAGPPPAAMP